MAIDPDRDARARVEIRSASMMLRISSRRERTVFDPSGEMEKGSVNKILQVDTRYPRLVLRNESQCTAVR